MIAAEDAGGDALAELMAADVGRHAADVTADDLHGIAAVAHPRAMAATGLRRAAVDHSDEVIGDDQAVFAFLFWTFRNEALFEDSRGDNLFVTLHGCLCYCHRGAG